MSSAMPMATGAAIVGSMMAGAGFWLSSPSHRQEIHLKERVQELEAQLGPNFAKHKHSVEEFFGMVDKDKDGHLTHEEVEEHIRNGGAAGFGVEGYSKMMLGLFFLFDAVVVLASCVIAALCGRTKLRTMHGKGKLKLHVDCLRYLPAQKVVEGGKADPQAQPVKFTPTVKVKFGNKLETMVAEKVEVDMKNHRPEDRVDVMLTTKNFLEVDFDEEDKKLPAKDALPSKKFPKRFFTLEVQAKTETESKDLGSQEVDIAELVDNKKYTVHLGGVVASGICRRKTGKFGEVIITPEWTWTERK